MRSRSFLRFRNQSASGPNVGTARCATQGGVEEDVAPCAGGSSEDANPGILSLRAQSSRSAWSLSAVHPGEPRLVRGLFPISRLEGALSMDLLAGVAIGAQIQGAFGYQGCSQ